MSHTTTIKVQLKSLEAIRRAALGMKLKVQIADTVDGQLTTFPVKLFSTTEQAVASVHLPDWKYPIAILANGDAKADNYNGAWGSLEMLDRFKQAYSAELVGMTADQAGMHLLDSHVTADGYRVLQYAAPVHLTARI